MKKDEKFQSKEILSILDIEKPRFEYLIGKLRLDPVERAETPGGIHFYDWPVILKCRIGHIMNLWGIGFPQTMKALNQIESSFPGFFDCNDNIIKADLPILLYIFFIGGEKGKIHLNIHVDRYWKMIENERGYPEIAFKRGKRFEGGLFDETKGKLFDKKGFLIIDLSDLRGDLAKRAIAVIEKRKK